jgi:hypothetical protein
METFWDLLKDPAHWWFELFLIFVFDKDLEREVRELKGNMRS